MLQNSVKLLELVKPFKVFIPPAKVRNFQKEIQQGVKIISFGEQLKSKNFELKILKLLR